MHFFHKERVPISILQFISAYFYKLSLIKTYGPNSFEARREYPFLISSDLEKAKIHLKRWSSEQLTQAINSLTMSDLKLRKYPSLFQRSILTQCFIEFWRYNFLGTHFEKYQRNYSLPNILFSFYYLVPFAPF